MLKSQFKSQFKSNKTKVLSVQLGKTLGLTKVPITKTEESTQVRKKSWIKIFLTPRGGGIIKEDKDYFISSLTYIKPIYQSLGCCYA